MTIKERMDKALEMAGQTKGAEISQGALKSTPVLFNKFFPGQKDIQSIQKPLLAQMLRQLQLLHQRLSLRVQLLQLLLLLILSCSF